MIYKYLVLDFSSPVRTLKIFFRALGVLRALLFLRGHSFLFLPQKHKELKIFLRALRVLHGSLLLHGIFFLPQREHKVHQELKIFLHALCILRGLLSLNGVFFYHLGH